MQRKFKVTALYWLAVAGSHAAELVFLINSFAVDSSSFRVSPQGVGSIPSESRSPSVGFMSSFSSVRFNLGLS